MLQCMVNVTYIYHKFRPSVFNIPYIEHLGYIVEAFYHVSLGVRVVTCCSEIGGNSNSRLVRCAPFFSDVGFFERHRYCPANTSPSRATFDKL